MVTRYLYLTAENISQGKGDKGKEQEYRKEQIKECIKGNRKGENKNKNLHYTICISKEKITWHVGSCL